MINLSAFIPMDRRQAMLKGQTLPGDTSGAALFADVTDFTGFAAALVDELGRRRGAEELLNHVNLIHEVLIAVLHHYGGSVIGFVGDAITCWLADQPGGRAAGRAVTCALAMQAALRPYSLLRTPSGKHFPLHIKVAIAAGPARRFLVGDPATCVLDTLGGSVMFRMAAAEQAAQAGEVVVSEEVAHQLGDALVIRNWRSRPTTSKAALPSSAG